MILVDEVMSSEVFTLGTTASLADARRLMVSRRIRHVPVVDDSGILVGLFTQRDLLAHSPSLLASVPDGEHLAQEAGIVLAEIMTQPVLTASPEDTLHSAALKMHQHRYGCLPVLHENQLVGILTASDFIGIVINLMEIMAVEDDNS